MKNQIYKSLQTSLCSNTFWLVMLVFVCHGLLPFNNGVYMDGWIVYGQYLNRDADALLGMFREAGYDGHGYFHLAFWIFPNIILAYKLVAFSSIILATLLVHALARRSRLLSPHECLFVAAIFCCYPAYQVHAEVIMVPSIFFYSLFLLATYIALRVIESEQRGWTPVVLRILSLLLFAISFQLGSLLVFYFPVLLFLLTAPQRQGVVKGLKALFFSNFRYCDFLLLPFAFWGVKQLLLPPRGLYAGYNQPSFSPKTWLAHSELFLDGAVTSQLLNARTLLLSHPLISTAFVIACVLAITFLGKRNNGQAKAAQANPAVHAPFSFASTLYISLFAFALLLCAIFPYVAVGKYATAMGWGTRLSLLIGLPIAVGLVAFFRLLNLVTRQCLPKPALHLFGALLITAFTLANIDVYIRLQARWIKDSSVIVNLRALPKESIEKVRVLIIEDQYRIPANDAGYDFFEYAGMFKLAWNEETRVGFIPNAAMDPAELIRKYPQRRYLLKDFRVGGCRATLHIHPHSPAISNAQLVTDYFTYRWSEPEKLQAFLQRVTVLSLSDMSCPIREPINQKG